MGVKRIYSELPEIQIDLPTAYVTLERFLVQSLELGYVPKKLAGEMPTKSRRRFVSEGDALHRTAVNLDHET
ncbi:unnamed protein product [Protopolystoma xenopodis]|uniref:Uncharacterized protein n=1 Tax=Protopolystoma xenopodis TaxID=117903 RepID=A0A3S5BWQ3_9PLAT|nr:unnamed protein product [Protopolystoma xenopodis]